MKELGFANTPGYDFINYKRRLAIDTKKKSEIRLKNEFAPCLVRLGKDMLARVEVDNDLQRRTASLKVSPQYSSERKHGAKAVLDKFKYYFMGEVIAESPNAIYYKEIWYDDLADEF